MKKLLIASNNKHKIEEFKQIFANLPFDVTYPAELGLDLDPEETGTTFEANATIKAEAFAQASGLLTLADDSGLEVDVLDKAPGVYSARYGHTAKNDHVGRYQLVLQQLAERNLSQAERTARFRCVIAIADPDGVKHLVSGSVEGYIAEAAAGSFGFGYDPIFIVTEFGKTMAQLPPETKHSISHRGRAAREALPILAELVKA